MNSSHSAERIGPQDYRKSCHSKVGEGIEVHSCNRNWTFGKIYRFHEVSAETSPLYDSVSTTFPSVPLISLTFLYQNFCSYEYMIDNILDLIKAATSSSVIDVEAVFENCHPFGLLEPSVMKVRSIPSPQCLWTSHFHKLPLAVYSGF